MVAPPGFSRLTTSVALFSAAVVSAVAVLAACGADDSLPRASEASVSIAADPAPTSVAPATTELPPLSATETVDPGRGSTALGDDADRCAPDIGAAAAAERDIATIPAPGPQGRWRAYNSGGLWCPGLSWIELDSTSSGSPVRPHQLLIYHAGRFQGTGITCDARHGQYVLATTGDAITVRYSYVDVADPEQRTTQNPVGKVVVTFRWNGSRVVMDGALPYAFTKGKC
ncbi:LppP/LprE family lipoprotein [Williamsia phyllosphaerae]|uniref:LppP/LprE lipoprotein n=1 Tax=Williamsia phyllosphaerae TaxID=885042 RepID=A0ABQ1V002_9NOCA|nr:LppP/LprE family lipoprotein [Williamsia phyllosphaerae]GGF32583.1 hypothetical protein GCM10007298_30600 [Williamsia phyllosphaerae]